ncbi:MAG: hypothetical protein ACK5RP_11425 [Betaproteobacteria bacterium]
MTTIVQDVPVPLRPQAMGCPATEAKQMLLSRRSPMSRSASIRRQALRSAVSQWITVAAACCGVMSLVALFAAAQVAGFGGLANPAQPSSVFFSLAKSGQLRHLLAPLLGIALSFGLVSLALLVAHCRRSRDG